MSDDPYGPWLAADDMRRRITDPYGSAQIIKAADGTITVESADPVIGIYVELWESPNLQPWFRVSDTECQLDPEGEYRYRLTGKDPTHRVLIFERVEA